MGQRLQAPCGVGQRARHHRRALGRPARVGHRRGMDDQRLRAIGHRLRPRGRPHRSVHRGSRRDSRMHGRGRILICGQALHDHRLQRLAQTDSGAVPANLDRRRR